MSLYTLATACVYLGLGLCWQKNNALNFVIKCALFGLGAWGLVLRFGTIAP